MWKIISEEGLPGEGLKFYHKDYGDHRFQLALLFKWTKVAAAGDEAIAQSLDSASGVVTVTLSRVNKPTFSDVNAFFNQAQTTLNGVNILRRTSTQIADEYDDGVYTASTRSTGNIFESGSTTAGVSVSSSANGSDSPLSSS